MTTSRTLRAGVAGADITPKPGPPLVGHGGESSHGVFAPLEVRVIVFESGRKRAAIISVDVLGLAAETTQRIREEVRKRCGIAPDHLMLVSSHTHCAPAAIWVTEEKPFEPFLRSIITESVRCVTKAAASLRPVRLGLGCGAAYFNINRRPTPGATDMTPNEQELVDHRVRVLTIEGMSGKPIGVLFHYTCHPTAMPGTKGLISPDYPGIARKRIESKLGCRALFLPGCAGNIRPNIQNRKGGFASATPAQLRACGWELGDEVVRVARSLKTGATSTLRAANGPLVLHYGPMQKRSELEAMVKRFESGRNEHLGPWAKRVIEKIDRGQIPKSRTVEMQIMQIGPVVIVATPGEPVIEIGHAIERRFRVKRAAADCWPLGYTNDALAYFCTPRHHKEGGYEPNAYVYDDEHATYEGEADVILNTALKLLEKIR